MATLHDPDGCGWFVVYFDPAHGLVCVFFRLKSSWAGVVKLAVLLRRVGCIREEEFWKKGKRKIVFFKLMNW